MLPRMVGGERPGQSSGTSSGLVEQNKQTRQPIREEQLPLPALAQSNGIRDPDSTGSKDGRPG